MKHFEEQIKVTDPLTEEMIEKMSQKTDHFDTQREVGNRDLHCIIETVSGKKY